MACTAILADRVFTTNIVIIKQRMYYYLKSFQDTFTTITVIIKPFHVTPASLN